MSKFYFSFGQDHIHKFGHITLDKDILLEIEAEDGAEARARVFASPIGKTFATSYAEDEVEFKYFPRGSIKVAGI